LQSTELAQVHRLVHALAEANLLIVNRDKISGQERVETCPTLAYHWPRWQKWLDEEQEFLLWRRHLDRLMSGWERAVPNEKVLLQGAALTEAEEWLEKRRDSFDSEGRVYIWQSLARHHWEQDRRWLVSIGLIVLLILGIVFILVQQMRDLLI
jgi:hypothetical protein